jgi:acetyl-CoA C-acetyltransferase
MGMGPVPATRKVLDQTGLSLADIDLIELNEALAAQVLAVERELDWDTDLRNVRGGAIALGHPTVCTGTRIAVTLLYAMQQRDAKIGLATLCVSGRGATWAACPSGPATPAFPPPWIWP